MADTETQAKKQRFGLFSQPPSNALGDDGEYKTKIRIDDWNLSQILKMNRENLSRKKETFKLIPLDQGNSLSPT